MDAPRYAGTLALDALPQGVRARVRAVAHADDALEAKLREIGFAEDDEVELLHRGPVAGKPLCVRLNRTLVALRDEEARAVVVEIAG